MRSAMFLITALSCMVISAGFFSRGNALIGVVTAAVGVFYIARVILGARARNAEIAARQADRRVPSDRETAALRAELESTLVTLQGRMIFTRSLAILLAGLTAVVFLAMDNLALALAICPFAIGAGFLFYRNAKAVELLETNL